MKIIECLNDKISEELNDSECFDKQGGNSKWQITAIASLL